MRPGGGGVPGDWEIGLAARGQVEFVPVVAAEYGDILFAASGETIEEIGKSAVNLIESQVFCGGDVILFRPDMELNATFSGYVID